MLGVTRAFGCAREREEEWLLLTPFRLVRAELFGDKPFWNFCGEKLVVVNGAQVGVRC